MTAQRHAQSPAHAQPGGDAVELGTAVEVDVLTSVDDVEARHPEEHGQAQHAGNLQIDQAANGDPGGQGSEQQRRPEPEVGQDRETLGIGIAANKQQHGQRQIDGPGIGRISQEKDGRGRHEAQAAHEGENPDAGRRQLPRGQMPLSRAQDCRRRDSDPPAD